VATRNDGIRAAHGDLVIFLDDDNVPAQSFIQAHIACHHAFGESHIAVMGNMRYATEAINQSNFAKYLQSKYLAFRSPSERGHIDYSNLPSRCLGTLNCSVRKSDLMAVGMFDTAFRYYGGEDEYLGYCLSRIGIRIVFCEEARTVHYDDLSLTRYKLKMRESAREGLPIQLSKCPDYVESTKVRYLIPVDWKRDSLRRIASKLFIRSVLNPIVVSLLERFAILTDRISQLYCRSLYRLLVSGWIIGGQSSSKNGEKLVTYGNK
jgi:GT2 family glycosyltransferase